MSNRPTQTYCLSIPCTIVTWMLWDSYTGHPGTVPYSGTVVHGILKTVGLSGVVGHHRTIPSNYSTLDIHADSRFECARGCWTSWNCPGVSKYGTWNTNKHLRNERTSETSVKTFFIEGCGYSSTKKCRKKKHLCSKAALNHNMCNPPFSAITHQLMD